MMMVRRAGVSKNRLIFLFQPDSILARTITVGNYDEQLMASIDPRCLLILPPSPIQIRTLCFRHKILAWTCDALPFYKQTKEA